MDYQTKYLERLKNHVRLVNKYANKLGLSYPKHDENKFTSFFNGYAYWSKPDRTEQEQYELDKATLNHIQSSPHHPEYWSDTDLTGFTRQNYSPNGTIDATAMPDEHLIEFCCDCAATGEEKGNKASDWLKTRIGTRWKFTPHQEELIFKTLEKLEK